MLVVLGIGNPGPEYDGTPHNLGLRVVDRLAGSARARFHPLRGIPALAAGVLVADDPVLLLKPLTYVNRCGPVLEEVRRRENAVLADLLVVVDDFQLPLGRLRLRARGSDGGHNGLASVGYHLGSEEFARLRLGIGGPGELSASEYVLRPFDPAGSEVADALVERAAEGVRLWARLGVERAMSEVNRRDLDQPHRRA